VLTINVAVVLALIYQEKGRLAEPYIEQAENQEQTLLVWEVTWT